MTLPKPPVPTYELELPSTGKTIKYRPFVVKEEKILLMSVLMFLLLQLFDNKNHSFAVVILL